MFRTTYAGRTHSFWLAMRAPSARAPSFAQAIVGSTVGAPAKVRRPLRPEEIAFLTQSAAQYVRDAEDYRTEPPTTVS